MTKNEMERAQDIESRLYQLRTALSQISRRNLFDIDSGGCSRIPDSFLAELETECKSYAMSKVNEEIARLEAEFKAL